MNDEERVARRRQRLERVSVSVEAHLKRLHDEGITVKCPACGSNNFNLFGPESGNPFDETVMGEDPDLWADGFDELLKAPVLPRVPLVCRRCSYILEFAWLELKNPKP